MSDDIFTQAINFFSSNPLILIGILLALSFILIFYFFFKTGKRPQVFKPIPLELIVKKQLDDIIKLVKVNGNFSYLRKSDVTIGRILDVGLIKFYPKNDKTKENKGKRLMIIKLSFNPNIPLIKDILDTLELNVRYAIIPYSIVKITSYNWKWKTKIYINIPENIEVYSFANIYIYGYDVYKFIDSISWLYARRSELEELVNYPKKIVFLETMHSKKINELEEIYKLEEKKFKSKMGSLAPTLKD